MLDSSDLKHKKIGILLRGERGGRVSFSSRKGQLDRKDGIERAIMTVERDRQQGLPFSPSHGTYLLSCTSLLLSSASREQVAEKKDEEHGRPTLKIAGELQTFGPLQTPSLLCQTSTSVPSLLTNLSPGTPRNEKVTALSRMSSTPPPAPAPASSSSSSNAPSAAAADAAPPMPGSPSSAAAAAPLSKSALKKLAKLARWEATKPLKKAADKEKKALKRARIQEDIAAGDEELAEEERVKREEKRRVEKLKARFEWKVRGEGGVKGPRDEGEWFQARCVVDLAFDELMLDKVRVGFRYPFLQRSLLSELFKTDTLFFGLERDVVGRRQSRWPPN